LGGESSNPPSPIEEEHKRGVYFPGGNNPGLKLSFDLSQADNLGKPAQGTRKV